MEWNLDKKRPICPQICEKLSVLIARDELRPGDRLMSVRDVAVSASVTPNTVQKSFEQLEQKGVIYSKRGSGWYVSENREIAREVFQEIVHSKTKNYVQDMTSLGLSCEEIEKNVKEFLYE